MCAEWVVPGQLLVRPDSDPEVLAGLLGEAEAVQFAEPLPRSLLDALAQLLAAHPAVELYVYGHYGLMLDADLEFLDGFEHVRRLSLNLHGLEGLDGLARFTSLQALTLQRIARSTLSVAALEHSHALERLIVDRPVRDLEVIRGLEHLTELRSPATPAALASLQHHPSLRRVILHRGTHRDLSALATCPALLDVELWQIRQLTATDLAPLSRIAHLEALALGAARHVTKLDWLKPGPALSQPREGPIAGLLRSTCRS